MQITPYCYLREDLPPHRGVRSGTAHRGNPAHPAGRAPAPWRFRHPGALAGAPAPADKHKVMQILVNLIATPGRHGRAPEGRGPAACGWRGRVGARPGGGQRRGIAPEVREKLFTHGFTTRKRGHGFGLHTSALAAKTLGGQLALESEGPGPGATATWRFPLLAGAPGAASEAWTRRRCPVGPRRRSSPGRGTVSQDSSSAGGPHHQAAVLHHRMPPPASFGRPSLRMPDWEPHRLRYFFAMMSSTCRSMSPAACRNTSTRYDAPGTSTSRVHGGPGCASRPGSRRDRHHVHARLHQISAT